MFFSISKLIVVINFQWFANQTMEVSSLCQNMEYTSHRIAIFDNEEDNVLYPLCNTNSHVSSPICNLAMIRRGLCSLSSTLLVTRRAAFLRLVKSSFFCNSLWQKRLKEELQFHKQARPGHSKAAYQWPMEERGTLMCSLKDSEDTFIRKLCKIHIVRKPN